MTLFQHMRLSLGKLFAPRQQTMFGMARVYEIPWKGDDVLRVLDVEGTYQSATYVDEYWCDAPFPYLRLFDKVFEQQPHATDLLMLGGGGFAYPKHLIAHHPHARIDVLEIDPAIIRLAYQYFFLDRLERDYYAQETGRLRIVQADAAEYLRSCAREGRRYDAILGDCFAAGELAHATVSPQGATLAHECLVPGGTYMVNVVTALEGPQSETLVLAVEALSAAFAHVWAIPCDHYATDENDNVLVAGSDEPPRVSDALRLFDYT